MWLLAIYYQHRCQYHFCMCMAIIATVGGNIISVAILIATAGGNIISVAISATACRWQYHFCGFLLTPVFRWQYHRPIELATQDNLLS